MSINNTPQAKDDVATATEDRVVTINVMANDLGGNGKSLYSVDQANPLHAALVGTSTMGATVRIVDGQIVYDSAGSSAVQALAAGQVATDTFNYVIQMGNGALSLATVTVTVTGTNDGPSLAADPVASHALQELAGVTGSPAADTATASLAFADLDLNDTHTVTIAAPTAVWTAGSTPAATVTALQSALTSTLTDSTHSGSGNVALTFAAADRSFDFLAAGEKLTVTYNVTVRDNTGAAVTRPVTFVVTGTNDGPVLAADTGPHDLVERAGALGSTAADAASTTLSFTDVDLTDHHALTVAAPSILWSGGATPPAALAGVLSTAMTATVADSAGIGAGSVLASFTAPDNAFDFLAQGETLTVTYALTVTDGNGATSTKPVTFVVTGTNDRPAVAADAGPHAITEAAGATGSPAVDTASATLTFTDVDLSDHHTVSVGAPGVVWSGGGSLPSSLAATLADALSTTLTDSTGTGAGSLTAAFSTADNTFDFLAQGETLTVTYDVTVSDGHGGTSARPVSFVVTGTNDGPVLAADASPPAIAEAAGTGSSAADTASTTLAFADVDLNDHHTVSVGAPGIVWSGGADLPPALAGLLSGALSTTLTDSAGSGSGSVLASFTAPDNAFDFLAQGETLKVTYDVTVGDGHGGTSTQPVTVTITGANDAPVLSVVDPNFPINERGGVTGDAGPDSGVTTLVFTDADLSDQHTLTVGGPSIAWSGGADAPAGLAAVLAGALSTSLTPVGGLTATDSTGTGQGVVLASFTAPDNAFDFLAQGETLKVTYDVTVDDGHGGTSTQPVTVTITGANDAPVLSVVDPNFNLTERGGVTGSPAPDQGVTTLVFSDTDLSDQHTLSVGGPSFVWSAGPNPPPGLAGFLNGALTTSLAPIGGLSATDSTGSGHGVVLASFSAPDGAFDFLAQGETLKVTYQVTVDDGHGGTSSQPVTVTITGTNDAPRISPVGLVNHGQVTEDASPTHVETANGLINFVDADLTDQHTVSAVLKSTTGDHGVLGAFTPQLTADASGAGTVTWSYSANDSALQYLAAGQSVDETYTVTVADGKGGGFTHDVTIHVSGANDAPVLSPAASNELIVNGDFSQGGFGWFNTNGGQGQIEVNPASVYSVPGGSNPVLEIDTNNGFDDVRQAIATTAGEAYTFSFDTALRGGTSSATNTFEVLWNGQVIDTVTAASTGFEHHSYTVMAPGASGTVEFREVNSDGLGGIVDNVSFKKIVAEQAGQTGSTTLDHTSTTLRFTDVDLADLHAVNIGAPSVALSGGAAVPPGLAGSLIGALTTAVSEANGAGVVTATFAAQDKTFDFLAQGQTLTVTYNVAVNDGHGGVSSQPVSFTVVGANDAPTVASPIADQSVNMLQPFSMTVPAGAFVDPDSALIVTARLADGAALPSWLSFNAATRTFSGVPTGNDVGPLSVAVTASDGSLTATDVFALTVNVVNQTLAGTAAAETLNGGPGTDTLSGAAGGDTLVGGNANDVIYGGATGQLGPAATPTFHLNAVAQAALTQGGNALVASQGSTSTIAGNDDGSSASIDITGIFGPSGLNFYGHSYMTLYVNNNGNITFGAPSATFTPASIAAGSTPIIAPFWADVDTRNSNDVTYSVDAQNGIFTATWDHVGYYNQHSSPTDTFQMQLINVGNGNFDIVFRYVQIGWTTGDFSGGVGGLGGQVARAGFNSGNGTQFEMAASGNQAAMLDLPNSSNLFTPVPGLWVFHVTNGVVVDDADYINGGAGQDTMAGGQGADTFVFHVGEAGGDSILDFSAGDGDRMVFVGYGAGATFTSIDTTHWQINYGADQHEIITVQGAPTIQVGDYSFLSGYFI